MRVTIVGTGYVGLVTGTCLADAGSHVVCVDVDAEKVRILSSGKPTIYEPGLAELLKGNLAAGRLRFTTDLAEGVEHADVLFVAVGTPPRPDGSADLSAVEAIIRDVGALMTRRKVIVIKSTVPVGTGRRMHALLHERTAQPFALVSNPEFLREGQAVRDFLHPDRVIIGCDDPEAAQLLGDLYAPFTKVSHEIQVISREAAEMVKYASNAYLACRISFINEIAEVCARTNVDINQVRAGMGADRRIGNDFLSPGAGYGGSCFPKDVQALIRVAQTVQCPAELLQGVHSRNERQKAMLAEMVLARFGPDLTGKTVAIWGLAFKPNTDDVREAPAIRVARRLSEAGATLRCYDPKAVDNARTELADCENVEFVSDPYDAVDGAVALVICTEWNEFRAPDFDRIRHGLAQRVIFDGRNLYNPHTMRRERIEYHSIGRPTAVERRRAAWRTAETPSQTQTG